MRDEITQVGFWFSKQEPHFPKPLARENPWKGRKKFITALPHLESKASKKRAKGSSTCRICAKSNGSITYRSGKYEWPEGFLHYVDNHNVRPPQEFIDFVMKKTCTTLRRRLSTA